MRLRIMTNMLFSSASHYQVCQLPPSFRIWRYTRPLVVTTRPPAWHPHSPLRIAPMHTATHTATVATQSAAHHNDAFLETSASHEALGISGPVAQALRAAGFQHPSIVQARAWPALLDQSQDVVLAAETGSGKTIAYLAPLLHHLLAWQPASSSPSSSSLSTTPGLSSNPDNNSTTPNAAVSTNTRSGRSTTASSERPAALILCPNAALCQQVLNVTQQLLDALSSSNTADGIGNSTTGHAHSVVDETHDLERINNTSGIINTSRPLHAAWVRTAAPPSPSRSVDVAIATPAALLNILFESGSSCGPEWTPGGFARRMQHIIIDEADLLLGGGFEKDTLELLALLRKYDRDVLCMGWANELGMEWGAFKALPRMVIMAGVKDKGGIPAMQAAGLTPTMITRATTNAKPTPPPPPPITHPWERQTVFAAATLPDATKKSVGATIRKYYPDALWLSGDQLHMPVRQVSHVWKEVGDMEDMDAVLRGVVVEGGRVLVFAQDVAAAERVVEGLKGCGLPVYVYHRNIPTAQRDAALAAMQQASQLASDAVLVCTDAAARGLDLQGVSHVVQAGFAHSAIDFLHRVGRTGRAGQTGKVTSLYTPDSAPLVAAIRAAMDAGQAVEKAFSRKRGFRKRVRRYGMEGVMPEAK